MKSDTPELIEQFESETGLEYDYDGPTLCECEYCEKLLQYIPDHSCAGMRMESRALRALKDWECED